MGPEWIGGGERPEVFEGSFEVALQREGMQALIERVELLPFGGGEDAGGAEPLVGRLGAIVDAMDPSALPGVESLKKALQA